MRALVIGVSGQVGAALVKVLRARGHEAIGTYATQPVPDAIPLDVRDHAQSEHLVAYTKPDWILCAGGFTHVDRCEDEPEAAFGINRDGPVHLARMGQRVGARFVYFSTDYVFDGTAGPYAEDAPVKPLSVYGRSKAEGERAVLEVPRSAVVRTSVVYGPERQEKNFVYQLLRSARGDRKLRPASDQRTNPTYSPDLAEATVELCANQLGGIWHLGGADVMDRLEFSRLVCAAWGIDAAWLQPVKTAELKQKAARPLDGGLRIDKARASLRTALRGPREGLAAMRAALNPGAGR